jgi:HSP20 family molecular chaperone IbpA
MHVELATAMQPASISIPIHHNARDAFEHLNGVYCSIAQRAFELFQRNGQLSGHDLENWLSAESEFLHPVRVHLTESNGGFTLRAEVSGFQAQNVEITIEPRRIYLSGKRATGADHSAKEVCCEWHADQICRALDLPTDVDTTRVNATLEDGLLTVDLPVLKEPIARNDF